MPKQSLNVWLPRQLWRTALPTILEPLPRSNVCKDVCKIKQGKKFWLRMTGEWQQSTPSYWERGQASFSKESMRMYINLLSSDSTPTDKPKTSHGLQTTNYIIFPTSDVKSKISWSLRLACYALAPSVFSRMTLSGILKILTIIYLFIF